MKKTAILIFGLLLLQTPSFCEEIHPADEVIQEETTEADIPVKYKYTIIKTTSNYTPIREGANVNARRFSHLKKGAKIFADEDNDDFYRIDLGLDKYYWIEKKYADVDSTANSKELYKIEKIKFQETDDFYLIKIKTPELTAYNEIETTDKSLDFILYDVILCGMYFFASNCVTLRRIYVCQNFKCFWRYNNRQRCNCYRCGLLRLRLLWRS